MNPHVDFHALAPEIVLTAAILVVLLADLIWPERSRWTSSRIASIGALAALIPVITLAVDGTDRSLFGGAFVVDNYALALQGFFLVVAYVTLLMSADYISEGQDQTRRQSKAECQAEGHRRAEGRHPEEGGATQAGSSRSIARP